MVVAAAGVEVPQASPSGWWQVLARGRAQWSARHPTFMRRVALARTVGLWLTLGYVVVALVLNPGLRMGAQAWLGAWWVVVAWFFGARTKTLTWSGLLRFFTACAAWSVAVGLVLARVSSWGQSVWGPESSIYLPGPSVFLAGIGEEALKLVPLVVLALAAPRRVSRLAAADFVLLGIAAGAAFAGVEETARRARLSSGQYEASTVPEQWVQFGAWPIPSGLANGFAGHVVTTGLLGATVGLAVALWRAARGRRALVAWRAVAVGVPALALVTMMADHVVANAEGFATDQWLDPGVSAAPWWLRVPWAWLGHGHYRPLVLVVLFVACVAVDAFRLAARPGSSLVPGPAWWPVATAGAGLSRWHARSRWLGRTLANAANGLLALAWIAVRDWRQAVAAYAHQPGEPRRTALARGAAAVSAQRALREAGMEHHAGPVHPWRQRLLTTGALAGLLVMTLVVAPDLVAHTGPDLHHSDHAWLSCTFAVLTGWWHSLSPAGQIAVGALVAGVVVLSGGSLGLGMGISGVATWGLDKSAGIATFTRNPTQATRSYFANATPAQLTADTLGVVMTFAPGNFAGGLTGRAAHDAYLARRAARSVPPIYGSPEAQRLADDLGTALNRVDPLNTGHFADDELRALAHDPAHGGGITPGTWGEAEVGRGLEQRGLVRGLIRSPNPGEEFLDASGQAWDVKAFGSGGRFDLDRALDNLYKTFHSGENVMIDTRGLTFQQFRDLSQAIDAAGYGPKVLWWP